MTTTVLMGVIYLGNGLRKSGNNFQEYNLDSLTRPTTMTSHHGRLPTRETVTN